MGSKKGALTSRLPQRLSMRNRWIIIAALVIVLHVNAGYSLKLKSTDNKWSWFLDPDYLDGEYDEVEYQKDRHKEEL